MIVEPEQSSHYASIRQILTEAFPSLEANLVERLRRDGATRIALVVTLEDRVVGQVAFSEMRAPFRALGLAPVAVAADQRRQGIAAALIGAGLAQAKAGLGNPYSCWVILPIINVSDSAPMQLQLSIHRTLGLTSWFLA